MTTWNPPTNDLFIEAPELRSSGERREHLDRACALVALDEALNRLEQHAPDVARLVQLRHFAGLSHQKAAETLGISRDAADRLWALGQAWLFRQLSQ
jgi:DNA-directed RNA polymerase specialized sigma24 family protein